jgi:hypothetical protein
LLWEQVAVDLQPLDLLVLVVEVAVVVAVDPMFLVVLQALQDHLLVVEVVVERLLQLVLELRVRLMADQEALDKVVVVVELEIQSVPEVLEDKVVQEVY